MPKGIVIEKRQRKKSFRIFLLNVLLSGLSENYQNLLYLLYLRNKNYCAECYNCCNNLINSLNINKYRSILINLLLLLTTVTTIFGLIGFTEYEDKTSSPEGNLGIKVQMGFQHGSDFNFWWFRLFIYSFIQRTWNEATA